MIEGINLIFYTIICVLLYLYLVLFTLINIFPKAAEIYYKLNETVYTRLNNIQQIKIFMNAFKKALIQPLRSLFIKFLVYLKISCEGLYEFEKALTTRFNYTMVQPVEYASLAIRKLYERNSQHYIVYSAFAIVVFYFILTIF